MVPLIINPISTPSIFPMINRFWMFLQVSSPGDCYQGTAVSMELHTQCFDVIRSWLQGAQRPKNIGQLIGKLGLAI